MLEIGNRLVNKLMMRIVRGNTAHSQLEVGDIVLGLLYRQIRDTFDVMMDWRAFSRGGSFASADSNVYGVSMSAQTQDNHVLWAARLIVKDKGFTRRKWQYNWSIVQISEDEISLNYAKCYRDNMAGSIKEPAEPVLSRDTLLDALFFSSEIKCMCGNCSYPAEAVELRENTLPTLMASIQDEQRCLPVMLITCPDVIPPEYIVDMMLGNMIVYWCADPQQITKLNSALPRELFTQWDTVHIIMPLSDGRAFHQTYAYEEIRMIGVEDFVKGLHRAFCENIRGKERRAFLTVEDVESCRYRGQLIKLANQCDSQKVDLDEMAKRVAKQTDELESIQDRLETIQRNYSAKDVEEYEELLEACMKENDSLRRGISALSTRLYASMGKDFQPDEHESIALLQELSHAIYVSLTCVSSRK